MGTWSFAWQIDMTLDLFHHFSSPFSSNRHFFTQQIPRCITPLFSRSTMKIIMKWPHISRQSLGRRSWERKRGNPRCGDWMWRLDVAPGDCLIIIRKNWLVVTVLHHFRNVDFSIWIGNGMECHHHPNWRSHNFSEGVCIPPTRYHLGNLYWFITTSLRPNPGNHWSYGRTIQVSALLQFARIIITCWYSMIYMVICWWCGCMFVVSFLGGETPLWEMVILDNWVGKCHQQSSNINSQISPCGKCEYHNHHHHHHNMVIFDD